MSGTLPFPIRRCLVPTPSTKDDLENRTLQTSSLAGH